MVELNIMVRVRWTAYCQGFSEPNTGPQWCQYEISDCGLRISDCRFRIADFGLQKNFAQFHALTVRRVMNSDEFKKRTKEYGLRIVRFVETLPGTSVGQTIGQLAELALAPILLPRWASWRKNAMSLSIGWKC